MLRRSIAILMLLILSAPVTAEEAASTERIAPPVIESTATEAELQLLQTVQDIQPGAVVALAEARATAQALQRARGYTEQWHAINAVGSWGIDGAMTRDKSVPPTFLEQAHWSPGQTADRQIDELDTKLGELRDRFLDLYHGHYGNKAFLSFLPAKQAQISHDDRDH